MPNAPNPRLDINRMILFDIGTPVKPLFGSENAAGKCSTLCDSTLEESTTTVYTKAS
jgi:hypothetical protein